MLALTRALAGDLGERPKQERTRFAVKHPLAWAMTPLIRGMVPLQGERGAVERDDALGAGVHHDFSDPQRNADALKATAYYLGSDADTRAILREKNAGKPEDVLGKIIQRIPVGRLGRADEIGMLFSHLFLHRYLLAEPLLAGYAKDLGYESAEAFSRAFKRRFGLAHNGLRERVLRPAFHRGRDGFDRGRRGLACELGCVSCLKLYVSRCQNT